MNSQRVCLLSIASLNLVTFAFKYFLLIFERSAPLAPCYNHLPRVIYLFVCLFIYLFLSRSRYVLIPNRSQASRAKRSNIIHHLCSCSTSNLTTEKSNFSLNLKLCLRCSNIGSLVSILVCETEADSSSELFKLWFCALKPQHILFHLFTYLFIYLFIYLSVCLSVCLFIYLFIIYLFIYLFIYTILIQGMYSVS